VYQCHLVGNQDMLDLLWDRALVMRLCHKPNETGTFDFYGMTKRQIACLPSKSYNDKDVYAA
jgi:hypothetical protein